MLTGPYAIAPPEIIPPAIPDIVTFAKTRLRFTPDAAQARLLSANPHRCIVNCSRQWGKSTVTAVRSVYQAFTQPGSLTLVLSPSARQSAEFLRKSRQFLYALHIKPRGDGHNESSLLLPNDSRIIGLPGKEDTIRGFSSVSLLIVDEAARVPDDLYHSASPMLAASDGDLWIISTPAGRRGFFYHRWIDTNPNWTSLSIPASECPRISKSFLEEQRLTMSPRTFRQEYECEFLDADDAVFSSHALDAVFSPLPPLTLHGISTIVYTPAYHRPPVYFIGVDLGQKHDYTAISILERAIIVEGERNPYNFERPTHTQYTIRYLERLPLEIPYPEIVDRISQLVRHPALGTRKYLVVDATGVGQPVVDLFRQSKPLAKLMPVILTGGSKPSDDGRTWRVPRHDLLVGLEIALQTERLKISEGLPEAQALLHEMRNLRKAITQSGEDVIRPERTSIHDDLVFATALANWSATEVK